jgi:catechol 2,3-dioxygenase-like lactoylglutathione lyase family enzyme
MRFAAIELLARDLSATRRFTERRLGWTTLAHDDSQLTVAAGATALHFTPAPDSWDGAYHLAFTIPGESFDDAHAWAAHRFPLLTTPNGIETRFHFADWNAHALYFADPDGNILELIARQTLPAAYTPPFGPGAIQRVSELGVVVEDVAATAARLAVPAYRAGNDTFQPLGDDDGLLIMVQNGRPWYPDERLLARPQPARLTLDDGRTLVTRADGAIDWQA